MPHLYIITGSNGAGKSTVGASYFPDYKGEIFDGDKLYLQRRSTLWKAGLKVQKELNKQASDFVESTFNSLVNTAIEHTIDFAYEGHFSRNESWAIPERFKANGYQLHLVFMGLSNLETSSNRVLIRAKEGGHFVDPLTLRENFHGNLVQLNQRYALFDSLQIIDTSELEHRELFFLDRGILTEKLPLSDLPVWFKDYLPDLVADLYS